MHYAYKQRTTFIYRRDLLKFCAILLWRDWIASFKSNNIPYALNIKVTFIMLSVYSVRLILAKDVRPCSCTNPICVLSWSIFPPIRCTCPSLLSITFSILISVSFSTEASYIFLIIGLISITNIWIRYENMRTRLVQIA